MSIEVTVDGHAWQVRLEATEDPRRIAVVVGGERRVIDVSWIDADTLSMIDGGIAREIRMHRRGNGAVGVEIGGTVYETAVQRPFREPLSRHATTAPGAVSVTAPMPGRVVRVLAAVGDRVSARQGVVVVEAMKMENELRAPRDGTVTEIRVAAGTAVETGTVLLVISD